MRVIFFGTSEFAVPSLERLVSHRYTVVACVTQPDRPQGRGLVPTASPVKQAAIQLGVPLSQPERLHVNLFEALHPEIGVVAAYGALIRKDLLALPPHGMLGVHPSLLPKYRGAAPVAWALLNGEATTGVTIFRLNERLDAGEIIVQERVMIQSQEDAQALTTRLARAGAAALVSALEMIEGGRARFEPQDDSLATLAPKLAKAQGEIHWNAPAKIIERLVRATSPWPGAATEWQGAPLKIWGAAAREMPSPSAAPGTVIQVTEQAVTVATGEGALDITDVQAAGRRRMSIKAFLAGHPVRIGEQFGATRDNRGVDA